MTSPDDSYALKDIAECARRELMLSEPHMLALTNFSIKIRSCIGLGDNIPMFDPCDGGVDARVLIFLEAPGRKAVSSQFVSRNNPDKTAAKINQILKNAGINRQDTILWNIVPWYIGKDDTRKKIRAAKKADIEKAMPFTKELITLLPNLDVIILMGENAKLAKTEIEKVTKAVVFCSAHPSPQVVNRYPEKILQSQQVFTEVSNLLNYVAPKSAKKLPLTIKDIDGLLAFLPIFNNPTFKPSKLITAVVRPLIEYDCAVKVFSELAWQPCWYSDYDPLYINKKLENQSFLERASIDDIKQVLTHFCCNDKWIDGYKDQLIENGSIKRLLERLKILKSELT